MPRKYTLTGPVYTFDVYDIHEAKRLGLIDSYKREGTHAPVSSVFEQGQGKLLHDWLAKVPDALLIATKRKGIVIYRPKKVVKDTSMPEGEMAEPEPKEPYVYHNNQPDKVEGVRGSCGKYCEGMEGIRLSGDSYADVLSACERKLEQWERMEVIPPWRPLGSNDWLYRDSSFFKDKDEFHQTVQAAIQLHQLNPGEFSAILVAEKCHIGLAKAGRVYQAVMSAIAPSSLATTAA